MGKGGFGGAPGCDLGGEGGGVHLCYNNTKNQTIFASNLTGSLTFMQGASLTILLPPILISGLGRGWLVDS